MRYILIAFACYVGYRFLVGFLIPVIRTTMQVKKQFEAVRENQQQQYQQEQPPKTTAKNPGFKVAKDDYLDFEEIK